MTALWITKCGKMDYSASAITKCQGGLQRVTGITKCGGATRVQLPLSIGQSIII